MKLLENPQSFLEYLSTLLPTNSICVEVGVLEGHLSQKIYNCLKPSQLYLIDPWENASDKNAPPIDERGMTTAYSKGKDNNVRERMKKGISEGKVILKKGFSYDHVDSFPDNFFDFIYIDATHLYGAVKADLEMFLPKLKKEGFMCGHDYINIRGYGVVKAVDEFVLNYNFEWVAKSLDDKGYGDMSPEENYVNWALKAGEVV